jgi:hypothetical protein
LDASEVERMEADMSNEKWMRRYFTPEYKSKLVKLVRSSGGMRMTARAA